MPLKLDLDVEQTSSRLVHAAYSVDLAEVSAQLPALGGPPVAGCVEKMRSVHGIETARLILRWWTQLKLSPLAPCLLQNHTDQNQQTCRREVENASAGL